MAAKRDEIIKRNLEFVYGKNKEAEKFDLDKHTLMRSRKPSNDEEGEGMAIKSFTDEYDYLAPSFPCHVCLGNDFNSPYPSYEHALMASKLANHPDRQSLCETIKTIDVIRDVKKLVNKNIDKDNNSWWKERCSSIAEVLLRDKFFRSKELRSKLSRTEKRALVFGNDYNEMIWGVHIPTGKGDNLLGSLLVKIREEISKGDDLTQWVKYSIIGSGSVNGIASIDVLVDDNGRVVEDESKVLRKSGVGISMAVIGKHPQNDVVVKHDSISSSHAVIVVVPRSIAIAAGAPNTAPDNNLVIIDLESNYKTKIDGNAIIPYRPVYITKESVITFGACVKRYRFDSGTTGGSSSRSSDVRGSSGNSSSSAAASSSSKEDIYSMIVSSGAIGDAMEKSRVDNTVYVGNIPYDMTEHKLKDMFRSCGEIVSYEYPKDRQTGKPRGYALITFTSTSNVTKALFLDGDDVNGRKLRVKRAESGGNTSSGHGPHVGDKRGSSEQSYGLTKRRAY